MYPDCRETSRIALLAGRFDLEADCFFHYNYRGICLNTPRNNALCAFTLEHSMSFEVTIVELSTKKLVGMKVRTNMQNAMSDCPAIWQTFGPKSDELTGGACADLPGYGVSVMVNENDFDYWAALEISPATKALEGMETIDVSAGVYAKCSVPGLAKLGEAYMFLWSQWLSAQDEYVYDAAVPSFELYPAHWNTDSDCAFEIYMPVRKK